jgi:GntR family transcriptional regulator
LKEKKERKISRKALYLEVIDFLLDDIKTGQYPPGSKLPSEDQLAREFSVSRVTLREALRVLEDDGVIVRRHGSGTFVLDKKAVPIQTLSSIVSTSTIFKRAGLEDRFIKVGLRKIPANQRIAEKLQLFCGQEIWEVERVRTIGDKPAIYSFDFFPATFVPSGEEKKLNDYIHSLYHFLAKVCGQTPDEGECTFKPIISDKNLSTILSIPLATPLMYIETIDFNADKQPILYSREYYIPELIEFQAHRRRDESETDSKPNIFRLSGRFQEGDNFLQSQNVKAKKD